MVLLPLLTSDFSCSVRTRKTKDLASLLMFVAELLIVLYRALARFLVTNVRLPSRVVTLFGWTVEVLCLEGLFFCASA